MASNIVLKTFRGGSVTPQDDAIIHETVIGTNGIFKGCVVSHMGSNILHISQGFGMIKGRFFEVYETNVYVTLNSSSGTLNGRLYIHMDLSNTDEPLQILTKTASSLPALDADEDVNYNNTSFDLELATFQVSNTAISNLVTTFPKITGASGASASSLQRGKAYQVGDFATCVAAPGWVTLYCIQAGTTAAVEPQEYGYITEIGSIVVDGGCIFTARDVLGELDALLEQHEEDIAMLTAAISGTQADIQNLQDEFVRQAENDNYAIGTVKYMSSADAPANWLQCDGRYVSGNEYPELVALLGSETPDADAFEEVGAGRFSRGISNVTVWNDYLWLYSINAGSLYRIDGTSGNVKAIPVTVANVFTDSSTYQLCLSFANGYMFLSQSTGSTVLIYQSEQVLTADVESITMKTSYGSGKAGGTSNLAIPYVVYSGSSYYCAYTYSTSSINYISFTTSSSGGSSVQPFYTTPGADAASNFGFLAAFSPKSDGLLVYGYYYQNNKTMNLRAFPGSYYSNNFTITDIQTWESDFGRSIPRFTASGTLLKAQSVGDGTVRVIFYPYATPSNGVSAFTAEVTVPKDAQNFDESFEYCSSQNLWVAFLGTGILFSRNPSRADSWGYLDTTSIIGRFSKKAGAIYDDSSNSLFLYGQDSSNTVRLFRLQMEDWFNYATDGAWLPLITSKGVPAYIKAKDAE